MIFYAPPFCDLDFFYIPFFFFLLITTNVWRTGERDGLLLNCALTDFSHKMWNGHRPF